MITHIIYSSISSSLLWLFYKLVMEGETMHRFKRVFLLLIFPISWLIPFIKIPENTGFVPVTILLEKTARIGKATSNPDLASGDAQGQPNLLLIIYLLVMLLLLARFLVNLHSMIRAGRGTISFLSNGQKVVLIDKVSSPFSFGNTLFVGKKDYQKGIEPEILAHEQAHMNQGHSWDIIFAELIIITNWFNPFAWLLKKSIQLNHEFLADWAVVKKTDHPGNYPYLLLNRSAAPYGPVLSNQFNYPPLKKRINMLFKNSPRWIVVAKQLLVIPMLFVLFFFFSNRMNAQGKPFVSNNPYPAAKENAPQSIVEQYKAIIDKYKLDTREGQKEFFEKITPEEKKKLVDLYTQMSKEQQSQQLVGFMKQPKPLAAFRPTAAQFEKWKNSSVYGIWLNDKRIKNEELNKYKNEDFSYFNVSKLSKNAINYGKHYYQVNLMTNAHYEEYVREQNARKDEPLMFIKWIAREKK